ncbi:GPALPP motifs-containing protein 1 [Anopheles maculipalpis]|uniref:GPALPP motifs-containing protein 1 n=1 Tax=Anopheles maculipalpis TaxID=1496333 RepID=UPI0021591B7E|nr:GPALPP motifs-containing protein 1 [Anopheles maculipalpis]
MSDSDTTDSDCGVRYKTTTTRHKHTSSAPSSSSRNRPERSSSYREDHHHHSSSRHSDRHRYRRSRSKSPDRKRHRRRSRSLESPARSRSKHYAPRSSKKETTPPRKEASTEKVLDISVSSVSSQDEQPEQQQQLTIENNPADECFGPALPPALPNPATDTAQEEIIGPALPPHLQNRKSTHKEESNDAKPQQTIGPALPPGFVASPVSAHEHISSESELSPFSEPEDEEEDQDSEEFIGPLPGTSSSRANVELEQRALELKIRQMEEAATIANGGGSSTVPKAREDWMLELPDIRKISDMGLGARQFRTREKPEIGDRTVWTDTPADRERKKKSGVPERSTKHSSDPGTERERSLIAKRDKEQEKMVKQHKKKHKRDKTLLEIHQTKLKEDKKASSDSSEPTRRPFDRNVDLHANRFDDAQKKAVMKKAQLLNSRFSSGSSKYL